MGKSLQEYIDDPELEATDDEIERLLAEAEGKEAPEPEASEEAPKDDEQTHEGEGEAKAGPEDKPPADLPKDEGEPKPVIKTRDGKHEIPYSVLEAERRRSREYQAELERLRSQSKAPAAPETPADTGDERQDMSPKLQELIEEWGADHTLVKQQRQLEELHQWKEQQERDKQVSAKVSVEEAIDSVFADGRKPDEPSILRQWQQDDDPLWDAAVAIDARLQNDPDTRDLPLTQRLERVVELLGRKPSSKPQAADLAASVERRLAEKDRQSLPNSLSDMPGGDYADQTELERLENMSDEQANALFDKFKNQDEIDAYLARL